MSSRVQCSTTKAALGSPLTMPSQGLPPPPPPPPGPAAPDGPNPPLATGSCRNRATGKCVRRSSALIFLAAFWCDDDADAMAPGEGEPLLRLLLRLPPCAIMHARRRERWFKKNAESPQAARRLTHTSDTSQHPHATRAEHSFAAAANQFLGSERERERGRWCM